MCCRWFFHLLPFFFWSLCCLFFFDIRHLITPLASSNFWQLYCLSFCDLRLLSTPLVFSNFWPLYFLSIFDLWLLITLLISSKFWPLHCLPFFDVRFWLPLWYLQTCITILFTKVAQLYSSGNKRKLHLYYIRRKSLNLLPYSTVLIDIIIMTRWFPRNWCL